MKPCLSKVTHEFHVGDVLTLKCALTKNHKGPHEDIRGWYKWFTLPGTKVRKIKQIGDNFYETVVIPGTKR